MDSFPTDFNFAKVEEKLSEQVANGEETAKLRLQISESCTLAIKNNEDYFRVNLKGVKVSIKMQLIKELFGRNFRIAYVDNKVTDADVFSLFLTQPFFAPVNAKEPKPVFTDKLPQGKRHIVELEKGKFVDAEEYIVPITKNFADKMTSYTA